MSASASGEALARWSDGFAHHLRFCRSPNEGLTGFQSGHCGLVLVLLFMREEVSCAAVADTDKLQANSPWRAPSGR